MDHLECEALEVGGLTFSKVFSALGLVALLVPRCPDFAPTPRDILPSNVASVRFIVDYVIAESSVSPCFLPTHSPVTIRITCTRGLKPTPSARHDKFTTIDRSLHLPIPQKITRTFFVRRSSPSLLLGPGARFPTPHPTRFRGNIVT